MDTENLKFLSIENGTLCNEEIDEGENFENSEMKPKNFKIFIYIFQCNVTKARNFEENFKDFTMNLSNSKKYKELQYINSYFTTWQRKIGKKILWAQQIPRYLSHPTWKICSNPFKNSINIQQIIIFESIYQISRKIQLCFLLCLKKKKRDLKFQLAEISISSVISFRLIKPEWGRTRWNGIRDHTAEKSSRFLGWISLCEEKLNPADQLPEARGRSLDVSRDPLPLPRIVLTAD